jgi:CDP-diacylglycerol--glycerol-3-phosphate 3-phosphatidyltransferase
MPDWVHAVVLVAVFATVGLLRLRMGPPARFERVERDGGSAWLGTGLKSVGYGALVPVGHWLVRRGVSADQVTWASLALGLAAGAALTTGALGLGASLGALGFVCDALDGLVARQAGTASPAGEVLDATVDRYVEFAWLGGLALYWRDRPLWLAAALITLCGATLVTHATTKAEAMQRTVPRGAMRRVERASYLTAGAALASLSVAADVAPAGWSPEWPLLTAVALVGAGAHVSAVQRLAALARALRRP